MLSREEVVNQLVFYHFNYDLYANLEKGTEHTVYWWLLTHNRIDYVEDGEKILGYCESHKYDYATLGKVLCGISVYNDLDSFELSNGNIAYVANTTIHPEYRNTWVQKELTEKFFLKNADCEYFCGQAMRKKHQPFKIFNRDKIFKIKERTHGRI